jgi:subtilisin family serine protease
MARRSTIRRFCGSSVALVLLCSIVPVIGGAKGGALALRTAEVSPVVAARLATADPDDDVTVIVRMRDRASLAAARNESTPAGRQRAVIVALRSTATKAQRSLRRFLDVGRVVGTVASYQPLWILDAVSVTATPEVINRIAARSDVEAISPDSIGIVPTGTHSAPPEPNVAQIGAPAAWAQGHDGEGVVVASLDSGVDAAHPDLASAYRGGPGAWFDPYGQHPTVPFDPTGHGTATMGVIVGGGAAGTTIGVAPGATWIAARVFDDSGNATATAVHAALQWALDPDGDVSTADAPAVPSLGLSRTSADALPKRLALSFSLHCSDKVSWVLLSSKTQTPA